MASRLRKSLSPLPEVSPLDQYNEALVANVRPPDWINPEPQPRYNLVVIGAGTAGLVSAAGAAGLGAKVALVERHLWGETASITAVCRPRPSSAPPKFMPTSGMPACLG